MFDRYYCIKSFCCHLKTLEKRFEKYISVPFYNDAQKHEGFLGFEKSCSKSRYLRLPKDTKLRSFVDDVNFCDGLQCENLKYKSRASTARELPD